MDLKLILEVHHSVPRSMMMMMMHHLTQLFAFDFFTHASIHVSRFPLIPKASSFRNNRLCETLSKAFWKSR